MFVWDDMLNDDWSNHPIENHPSRERFKCRVNQKLSVEELICLLAPSVRRNGERHGVSDTKPNEKGDESRAPPCRVDKNERDGDSQREDSCLDRPLMKHVADHHTTSW